MRKINLRFCPELLSLAFISMVVTLIPVVAMSQALPGKTLGPADFLIWNTIRDQQISSNGAFVSYRLVPGEGDPTLMLYDVKDSTTLSIPRVSKSSFDYEANIVFGVITPSRDTLRALERKKTDRKKWPCDTLFIQTLDSPSLVKIPYVVSYSAPSMHGDWIAFTIKQDGFPTDTSVTKKNSKKDITHLIVRQLSSGFQDTLKNVKEFTWADKAPVLLSITEAADSTQTGGVVVWKNHQWEYLKKLKGAYAKLSLAQDGNQIAFLANLDTTKSQVPPWSLYYTDFKTDSAVLLSTQNQSSLPLVNKDVDLKWSEDGHYLFYGRSRMPVIVDTTLLADEKVNVEIWNTEDSELYTMQKFNKANEEKRAYPFAYDTQSKKHTQIGSPAFENVALNSNRNSRFALLYTDKPYQKTMTWLSDAAVDLAVADLQTGKVTPFRQGMYTSPRMSPEGKFAYGYSNADSTWWTYQLLTGVFTLMKRTSVPHFYDEQNDTPGYPDSYGTAGWTTDDQALIIYDRYDIWSWSPMLGKTPVRLTEGRASQLVYRYIKTDAEEKSLSTSSSWLLQVTNDIDKSSGYVWFSPELHTIDALHTEPMLYARQVAKARKADTFVFTKENFKTFPDLQLSTDRFASSFKISNANPQQQDYKWGTIALYHWMDGDSVMRTGMLVKPAGYDSLHAYPTIVNFYERSSNDLHNHPTIVPHRSTINYALYASRGYVIFNPDITYAPGQPGESAYQIVLSGVNSLMKKGIADPKHLALQGHSWGGYQIAYLLTRTNMFACAEAGAAVVNMTSAYGGIRGESGRARMFQYEQEQSRLGKSLWADPKPYIENSPLFKIDKIETPLLLLHNDADGAVPFQQGIEFYLALRRNGKQAWLLNYPGEPHWPVKWENRKDFQTRMLQFFDFYLQGAPEPEWMKNSVPLVNWQ